MLSIARDAAFSAGAVALLEKPVTTEALDEVWDTVLGDVPDAPGLEDLDELYPGERIKVEEDTGPILPQLPPLPLPLPVPELDELPVLLPPTPTAQPKKKKGKGKLLFGLLIIVAGALGVAYQQGMLPV